MPRYHLKIMIFPKKEGGEFFLTWPIYPKCKNNHILLLTRSPKLTFRSGYSWSSHLGLILAQICLRSVLERYLDWLKYTSALVYFGSPIPPLYYQLPRLPLAILHWFCSNMSKIMFILLFSSSDQPDIVDLVLIPSDHTQNPHLEP